MTIIVCSHTPGEGHFHSRRFPVAAVVCVDDFAYWRGLAERWDGGETIVNVEHDIEVSDAHLAALIDCREPLCSWAYECHWQSTHLPFDVIAAGNGDRHLRGGEEWAEWSAIGLVKIAPSARVAPLRREPWPRVELAVAAAVRGPWHVHWPPVTHHHY